MQIVTNVTEIIYDVIPISLWGCRLLPARTSHSNPVHIFISNCDLHVEILANKTAKLLVS